MNCMLCACGTLQHEGNRVNLDFLEKDCMHVSSTSEKPELSISAIWTRTVIRNLIYFSFWKRFHFSFYLVSERKFLFLFRFSFHKRFSFYFSFSLTNLVSFSFSFSFSYQNIPASNNSRQLVLTHTPLMTTAMMSCHPRYRSDLEVLGFLKQFPATLYINLLQLTERFFCTWFWKVQDVDYARPPTDRVLFHGRTTHFATEASLPPGHVFGTASQYTCATKTSVITVFSVNSKRFGFNVASGAQCNIPINCAVQILLIN